MRGCELTIELDRPEATFRPGEIIHGRIRVRTDEDRRCDQLRLRCEWRTHGRGNQQTGQHVALELGPADWRAGQDHEHPFDLPAPSGPLTYHGHVLDVGWYLCARADVPWAIDPVAQREFELRPWTAEDLVAKTGGYRDGVPRATEAYTFGPLRRVVSISPAPPHRGDQRVGIGCLGGGLLTMLLSVWPLGVAGLFVGGFFSLTGLALLVVARNHAGVHRMLGGPRATLVPREAAPGSRIELRVEVSPPKALRLSAAVAELTGKEVVETGAGSSRTAHEHQLVCEAIELAPQHSVLSAGPQVLVAEFEIPDDAPVTFTAADNEVRWTVRARIVSEAAWDWYAELPLTVRPRSARALPAPSR